MKKRSREVFDETSVQFIVDGYQRVNSAVTASCIAKKRLCAYSGRLSAFIVTRTIDHLIDIDVSDNRLTSLPDLGMFPSLQKLSCYSNCLTSLVNLGSLTKLTCLLCGRNQLATLDGLVSLCQLRALACERNQLTVLDGLESLYQLESLSCGENQLTTLESPRQLKYLFCDDNQLTNLRGLGSLSHLVTLSCGGNQLTTLDELGSLGRLRTLVCDRNQLTSLGGLGSLTRLSYLRCTHNLISSLHGIECLTKLRELCMTATPLTDVSSIQSLDLLTYIVVERSASSHYALGRERVIGLLRKVRTYNTLFALVRVARHRQAFRDILRNCVVPMIRAKKKNETRAFYRSVSPVHGEGHSLLLQRAAMLTGTLLPRFITVYCEIASDYTSPFVAQALGEWGIRQRREDDLSQMLASSGDWPVPRQCSHLLPGPHVGRTAHLCQVIPCGAPGAWRTD